MSNHLDPAEPSDAEIEAAARGWFEWQFKAFNWDTATQSLRDKFKEGAKLSLQRAAHARAQIQEIAIAN